MNHTSFTMQQILNQPLDPNLCKRILQQIKSPLQEQSFAMTNDESISSLYINAPKRPNIPPPSSTANQYRRPAIKGKYNTFSNGESFYNEESRVGNIEYGDYTKNINFLEAVSKKFDGQIINTNRPNNHLGYPQSRIQLQSVVSPLDPNITLKKQQQKPFLQNIWSHLCGNTQNFKFQDQQEINYDQEKSKYQRKKIFDGMKTTSILQALNQNKYTQNQIESILLINENDQKSHISVQIDEAPKVMQKSVKDVLEELRKNKHHDVAQFLQVLTKIIGLIKTAQNERKFLLDNIQMVYQLTSNDQQGFKGIGEDCENYSKFFPRMKCSSIGDLIKKISRNRLVQTHNSNYKQYNEQKNKVSDSLESMLKSFSSIELIIQDFLKQPGSINILHSVYQVLNQKFTQQKTKNTLQQITSLLKDVRLLNFVKDAYLLEYLWDSFTRQILTQNEFINGLTKTHGRYVNEKQMSVHDGYELEVELSKMGFVRN